MSYTTRRTGGIPGTQQHNNVGGIGQRRPVVTNNFVPGGTMNTPQTKQAPVTPQHSQLRQPGAQNNTTIHFRNQQQTQSHQQQQQQSHQQQQQQSNQQQLKIEPSRTNQQVTPQRQPPSQTAIQQTLPQNPIQQRSLQIPTQQKPPQQQATQLLDQKPLVDQQQPADQKQVKAECTIPVVELPENGGDDSMDTSGQDNQLQQSPQQFIRRKPWFRRNIPRREMMRKRNFKLSKILKPKNAVAILNELIKDLNYEIEIISNRSDGRTFRASVNYDGIIHEGFGYTEDQAKNGAAEVVLKHYIKSKKMEKKQKKQEESVEKMDVNTDDENAHVPLPWQHVASFAMYKLFSQWEEDPNLVGISASYLNVKPETKSSKNMPPNPETINPIMLLNQMMPKAKFEEIARTGNPPQIIFSFKCTVDDHSFIGTGTSKKIAKRTAAYEACYKLLGITYPPDVFVPSDFSSNEASS